jgi:CubicO group peptidase (beta-lactamase class C family)
MPVHRTSTSRPPIALAMFAAAVAVPVVLGPSAVFAQTPAAPAAPAEPALNDRLARLSERLDRARVEHHIPGMSLAIVQDDKVIYARGFGLRDVEKKSPADEGTKYAIGSSTKAFTSLLVAMMVDEGKMSWDEPVRTHLPQFKLSDADADGQVTIRDVLSHRTGLGRTDLLWANGRASPDEIFAALATAELKDPFRKAFNYNNIGFLAAGQAAANAAGTTWPALVRARILDPLGMSATDTSIDDMQMDPQASKGYLWDEDKNDFKNLPMRSIASCAPAGAINSTVLDMARWLRLQLGTGRFDGKQLVSEAALRETWKSNIELIPGIGYGLGWMLHDVSGTPVVEHGGNIDGFAAEVAMLPEKHAGFVLLTNVSYTSLATEAQSMVWETLFPTPPDTSGAMTEDQLKPCTGKFRFDTLGVDVTILIKEGKLWCDVPGQTTYELKWPDKDGKWAFAITDTIKISFEKTPDGRVPSLTLFQAGMEFKMPRLNADGSVVKGPEEAAPFGADQLRDYTGTYHFALANQDWRVQIKDGKLAIDVPGQTVYTLKWPDADGKWPFAVTDAIKVSFEKDAAGKVNQLTCYQAGQTLPMPKTAPGDDGGLPTVDAIMARRAVQSDPATAKALGTIRVEGTMRFVQQGVTARVTSLSDPADRFNFSIDLGRFGAIRMASDGGAVWSETLGQPIDEVTGARAGELRREATSMFVKDLRKEFQTVEVLRKDSLDGKPVIVLRARAADGKRSVTEYVDPESGLPLKEESTTTVPGVGSLPSSALFADYKDFEGLKIPTTVTIESLGTGKAIMTIESVKTHVQAGPGEFLLKPAAK